MATNISPFISEQFPALYREDGEFFIEFLKSYYKWLEESGNPLYHSRRLPEYFDIDNTPEDFIIHFKEKYLPDFALLSETDKRTLVKYALDIYRSKGSIRSLKLLFKLVYADEIDVYWPGDDILRPSDAKFTTPRYLEVGAADKTITFVGKEIFGDQSGARGIVESVSRRNIQGTIVDVIQMTNVRGNFVYDELVTTDGIVEGAPRVVGSLTTLQLMSGGRNFTNGQVLDVISDRVGFGGKAKVVSTYTQSGQVSFELLDGGGGYSVGANNVLVSERVMQFENKRGWTTPPFSLEPTVWQELEYISQPLVTISLTGATAPFPANSYIYAANSVNGVVAFGAIANTTQNSTSYATGTLIVSDRTVSTLSLSSIVSPDPDTLSFDIGSVVYQRKYSADGLFSNTAVGTVFGANSTTILVDVSFGAFVSSIEIDSSTHPTTANVSSIVTNTNRFTNGTISQYWLPTPNALTNPSDETASIGASAVDRTATAQYLASNTTHVGLYNISPSASFIGTPVAYFKSLSTNVYANAISLSSGTPGTFDVTSIENTESVYLNSDKVYANNTSNIPFTQVAINATAYGFEFNPTANLSSTLISTLEYNLTQIGTVSTIGNINPGSYNTISPMLLIREPYVAPFGRKNYELTLTNRNSFPFIPGELLTTSYTAPTTTIQYTTLTGNSGFDEVGMGEVVYQVRSDGIWVYGSVYTQNTTSSPKTLTLTDVYATANQYGPRTSATFNTSNNIVGVLSSAVANTIGTISTSSITSSQQGVVVSANDQSVIVERIRFPKQEINLQYVTGAVSGANGDVVSVVDVLNSPVYGQSASVSSEAGTGTGVASEVAVIDSGFVYTPDESVTLIANSNPFVATALAKISRHGVGTGYWDTTDGFISHDKKIQDSEYYQEFSYEIRSSLAKSTYERRIRDIAHVAGTEMYGAVISSQVANSTITAPSTNVSYKVAITNVSGFSTGDEVRDATSNVYGTVVTTASSTSNTFNGFDNVIAGAVVLFNSNTDITNGYKLSFNANTSVTSGKTINFNANNDVVQGVNFTFNGTSAVSNVVSVTFNASSNVYPGVFVFDFGSSRVVEASSIIFNTSNVVTGTAVTFNANTSVANSTTVGFNSNTDINSGKLSFDAYSGITPAYSVTFDVGSTTTVMRSREVYSHTENRLIRWDSVFTGTYEKKLNGYANSGVQVGETRVPYTYQVPEYGLVEVGRSTVQTTAPTISNPVVSPLDTSTNYWGSAYGSGTTYVPEVTVSPIYTAPTTVVTPELDPNIYQLDPYNLPNQDTTVPTQDPSTQGTSNPLPEPSVNNGTFVPAGLDSAGTESSGAWYGNYVEVGGSKPTDDWYDIAAY